ncbi:MAG: hypothetical protein ABIH92_05875 [Nanoarchaeota archaeon]
MGKIHASLIIEILGRPVEHVKEALNTLVVKLSSEKGVKVINKTYHDPTQVEDTKDLFTAFAEVDVELDSLENYFGILFAYMPSHIEITHPEKITLTNANLADIANVLVQRLHNYDAITKKMIAERNILLKKLKEIAPHLFKQKDKPQQGEVKKETKKKAKKKSATKKKKKKN